MTDTADGFGGGLYAENMRHRAIKWAEGVAALSVIVGMRACEAALEAIPKTDDLVLRHVLFSGLVVSYARAFEEVKHPEVDVTRKFSIRGVEAKGFNRSVHDALLAMRDDQIAHVGHGLNDYALTFLTARVTMTAVLPDGTVTETSKRHVVGTRARASIAIGLGADVQAAELLAHVKALAQTATGRLATAIVEHDAASLFQFEQAAADGKSYAKTLAKKSFRPPPGLLVFDDDDLAVSLARASADLGLAFALLTFRIEAKGKGLQLNCTIYEVSEQDRFNVP